MTSDLDDAGSAAVRRNEASTGPIGLGGTTGDARPHDRSVAEFGAFAAGLWRRPWAGTGRLVATLLGLGAALAIIPIKSMLNEAAGRDIGFIPAITAVLLAASIGGFLPGMVATVTGILVETTFFMEPAGSTAPLFEADRLRLAMFALLGAIASLLAWLRASAEERARAAAEETRRSRAIADIGARRLDALQALTIDLAEAVTTDDIADRALSRGVAALRADRGEVFLIEPAGGDPRTAAIDARWPAITITGTTRAGAEGIGAGGAAMAQVIDGSGISVAEVIDGSGVAVAGAAATAKAAQPGDVDAPGEMDEPGHLQGSELVMAGAVLRLIAVSTDGGPSTRHDDILPIDRALPATEVARTGAPVFIEDPSQYMARYGSNPGPNGEAASPRSVAAVPLIVEGRRLGVLGFTWDEPHLLPRDRRAFVAAVGQLAAAAIERGRLFDAERAALLRAEAAQRRLDLLAGASRILGMSLDYDLTLRRLAGLALPLMGDACIVDAPQPDGVRRLVASAEPELAGYAATIEAALSGSETSRLVSDVLAGGRAAVFAVDRAAIEAMSRTADEASALEGLGCRWALVVPIQVRERMIGAMAFLRREDRRYGPEEVTTAEELGGRAGRALENARLHGEVAWLADREQQHAAELEAVLAALGEGILVVSPDGRIRSSNTAAVRILGNDLETLEGLLDRLLTADGNRPETLEPGPVEYRLAGRQTSWIEVTSYPVADPAEAAAPGGNGSPLVVMCRDVTAFRQGQALREAFLGLLSHELRTPVTTIYGGSAILSRPGADLPPAVANDILADIAGEADRLYRLVEDLLVLARFDEGIELGGEPALLQHLVPAVVAQERGRWLGVSFEPQIAPDLPAVSADETSIVQVVRNLLSNAAKYSASGGTVTVVVERVSDGTDDGVAVRVRDSGPGIDPAEADAIFSPFFRSPSTARMAGGAGIGLYVSRRLVDTMGGRIWAKPRPEGGSEFSFVLPLYATDADE